MKKSNKILLAAALATFLILLAVHVALYAKYENGDYKLTSDAEFQPHLAFLVFDQVKYVSVKDAPSITVYPSDTTKLAHDEAYSTDRVFSYRQNGDTLFITGRKRRIGNMQVYVDSSVLVQARQSELFVQGANGSGAAPSFRFELDNAELHLGNGDKPFRFGTITVTARNGSSVYLHGAQAKLLQVQLHDAFMDMGNSRIDSIALQSDERSRLQINPAQLPKLNTKN